MNLTYYGQSCFMIQTMEKKLLVDPMISPNPMASSIDIQSLMPDYILLTHGHYDHVADAESIAKQSGAMIIASYEVATWYGEKGLSSHGMNLGGKNAFDFGVLKYVPAVHSSVLPDGTNGGPAGGFVLWNEEACIYIAGDTALSFDMQLIQRTCPKLNIAILPVGDNFTMGYEDALIASDFIGCDRIVGCHFDTFPQIKIDHTKVSNAFKDQNKSIILPLIGEEIAI